MCLLQALPALLALPIPNPVTCPASIPPGGTPPAFTPAAQPVALNADGNYLLYYFAQDCAGTQELKFVKDGSGSWSTSYYTVPINVDTVLPAVSSGPTSVSVKRQLHRWSDRDGDLQLHGSFRDGEFRGRDLRRIHVLRGLGTDKHRSS